VRFQITQSPSPDKYSTLKIVVSIAKQKLYLSLEVTHANSNRFSALHLGFIILHFKHKGKTAIIRTFTYREGGSGLSKFTASFIFGADIGSFVFRACVVTLKCKYRPACTNCK
jgi:hypothetical protein